MRELGTIEKLRPYAIPSADWVASVADRFRQAQLAHPVETSRTEPSGAQPGAAEPQPSVDG
jgi:hypothetical protein